MPLVGGHVVGPRTATGERDGGTLRVQTVLVFHLRDGKVAKCWEHQEDQAAFDDFIN